MVTPERMPSPRRHHDLRVAGTAAGLAVFLACTGGETDRNTGPVGGADSGPGGSSGSSGSAVLPPGAPECPSGTEVLLQGETDAGPNSDFDGLAISGENLYVSRQTGEVQKLPRCGGAPTVVGNTGDDQRYTVIAADGNAVYVGNRTRGKVTALPVGGGPPRVLAEDIGHVTALATNGVDVFFATQDSVDGGYAGVLAKVSPNGGAPTTLATTNTQGGFAGIALDETTLYVTDAGVPGQTDGQVVAVPIAGGDKRLLATKGMIGANAITRRDGDLFIASQAGPVYRLPTTGGEPRVIGGGIQNAAVTFAIGSDVYFSNNLNDRGTLLRVSDTGSPTPTTVFEGGHIFTAVALGKSIYVATARIPGQAAEVTKVVRITP
jgi:hypothetical protein